MFAGGLSNAIASSILNPMDITKTKMQLALSEGNKVVPSFLETVKLIHSEKGLLRGLYTPGLFPSILREFAYCGVRVGCYPSVRGYFHNLRSTENNSIDPGLSVKAFSAVITGSVGSVISNPFDVVKVRFMADSLCYPSTFSAFRSVYLSEGFFGGLMVFCVYQIISNIFFSSITIFDSQEL